MNKKLLNKILIIFLLIFTFLVIASNNALARDIPIPDDQTRHHSPELSPTGHLLIIAVSSAFTLIPFFVLEFSFFKNQNLLESTTDEDTIKKTKKYITTIVVWSTIFLTFWLALGFYIIVASDYFSVKPSAYLIFAFFAISILILLLKVITLLRFKKIDGSTIAHIVLILEILTYYLSACHDFLYDTFK